MKDRMIENLSQGGQRKQVSMSPNKLNRIPGTAGQQSAMQTRSGIPINSSQLQISQTLEGNNKP